MTSGNSFSIRVVKPCNSVAEDIVTAPSVKAFEARIDKIWKLK